MSDIITVDVAERDFFSLPFGTQQLFRAYGEPRPGPNRDTMRFDLAGGGVHPRCVRVIDN